MGLFRAVLEQNAVKFTTSTSQTFENTVIPNNSVTTDISISGNTIQAGVHIAWGFGSNDLSLNLYDTDGNLRGESSYLNAPGLSGRKEKITLNYPEQQTFQVVVRHTGNIGTTAQRYFGAIETTRADYAQNLNLQTLSPQNQGIVKESLRSFLVVPQGKNFNANFGVTRAELAAAIVRSGRVPQYLAANPVFSDVRNLTTRGVVESVQTNPTGKIFFDASPNGAFYPDKFASKLVTAIALIKAATLESAASTAV